MKNILPLILAVTLITTGCSSSDSINLSVTDSKGLSTSSSVTELPIPVCNTSKQYDNEVGEKLTDLNDEDTLKYIEDNIYINAIDNLNSDQYYVNSIDGIYLSKEYLQEVNYNTQENVFFGYTPSELEKQFGDKKYVFTVDDNYKTKVIEYEGKQTNLEFDKIIKNVSIGSGVILFCVTVSCIAGAADAPAICMIFSVSAKSAAKIALMSGGIGALFAGVSKKIETGDTGEAMISAALEGSKDYAWGAIVGAVSGGLSETIGLQSSTNEGLTISEAAKIQKESHYPLSIIKQFKSMDKYGVYRDAGLTAKMVSGKLALVPKIDYKYASELNGEKISNLVRMQKGYAPIDPSTDLPYQLHHIDQCNDGTLAVLTQSQHMGNSKILNIMGKTSEIDRGAFSSIKEKFWQDYAIQCLKW